MSFTPILSDTALQDQPSVQPLPSPPTHADLTQLAYAFGKPSASGVYKVLATDFEVEEQIAFPLSGVGEHLWCWVEKQGENTDWVAQQLAKWANVPTSRVGIAGQKDRHAVTRQWFSIQLPGLVDPHPDDLALPNVRILKMLRHQRKLQTGGLAANRFTLNIRGVTGDMAALEQRLQWVKTLGVPNYFGEQRFGHHGRNLLQAQRLLAGELPRAKRNQKSLYLSALRSWVFNLILSERVTLKTWNQLLPGDVLQLEGSNKWFVEDGSPDLAQRVAGLDLHPTGLLVADGQSQALQQVKKLEESICQAFPSWLSGLHKMGLKADRRPLRVVPLNFEWRWLAPSLIEVGDVTEGLVPSANLDGKPVLQVAFTLRPGSYATMVLREILHAEDFQAPIKA